MFNKRKQPPIRTLIGEGTVIRGELRFAEGLRIDGEVVGDVLAADGTKNMLVISERARVIGRVKAGHVIINGHVTGPVQSDDLLELQPKAVIVGHVSYQMLEMHQGATIDGDLHPMQGEGKPPLKLATTNGG